MALDRAGAEIIGAVLSGGATVSGSIEQVHQQILLEWGDLLSWAYAQGVEDLRKFAGDSLAMLVDGAERRNPDLGSIEAKLGTIGYEDEIKFDIDRFSGVGRQVLAAAGTDSNATIRRYSIDHLGFTVALDGGPGRDPAALLASWRDRVDRPIDPPTMLGEVLEGRGDLARIADFFQGFDPSSLIHRSGFADLRDKLIGSDVDRLLSELKPRVSADGTVDLGGTSIAVRLEDLVKRLALGDGKATLSAIWLDLRSGSISASLALHNRLTLGNIADALAWLERYIASFDADMQGRIDALTGLLAGDGDVDKLAEMGFGPLMDGVVAWRSAVDQIEF